MRFTVCLKPGTLSAIPNHTKQASDVHFLFPASVFDGRANELDVIVVGVQ